MYKEYPNDVQLIKPMGSVKIKVKIRLKLSTPEYPY